MVFFFKKFTKEKKFQLSEVRKEFFLITKRLPDIVHLKQLVFFSFLLSIIILVLFVKRFSDFKEYYISSKPVFGGSYSEGVVGEIKKINPLFSATNPAEDEISKLIFSGLTKIGKKGKLEGDLASSWTISPDGKTYEFVLRDNLRWHDGRNLTADDVIFTIQAIQNPETRSSYFPSLKGVIVEKISDKKIKIALEKPLNPFIYVTDFGILPKHLLEKVPTQNLKVTEYNQAPVGSGPFEFEMMDIKRDYTDVFLKANKKYYTKKPYLEKIKIRAYRSEDELLDGYVKKEIQGISRISLTNYDKASKLKSIRIYSHNFSEYTAVFFNFKNDLLKDNDLRKVFSLSTGKDDLVKSLNGAISASGPIPSGVTGKLAKKEEMLDLESAKSLLEKMGWKLEGDVRKKDGRELKFNLLYQKDSEYEKTAEYLKERWGNIGVKIEIISKSFVDLQQNHIRPRNYDLLLFSQNLGATNDIYPFWHSSFKTDPGLNLSYIEDKKLDKYLEIARESMETTKTAEMLGKAQEVIFEEKPAVFLYSSPYYFGVSESIKGINISKIKEPKDRFYNIEEWFPEAN